MNLSIESVLTMCILCSILLLMLCLISKIDVVMEAVGADCLTVLLFVGIIRMFFPLESSYTYSIYIEDVLMPLREGIRYAVLVKPVEIRVWQILLAIWLGGCIVCLLKKIVTYRQFMRFIRMMPELNWETLCAEYGLEPGRYADMERVRIVRSGLIQVPYIVGIRNFYLALPETRYEQEEFRYIVLHEMMHVKNKDTIWKMLIDLLCSVFWWNPALSYVKRELFQIVEIRNDEHILSMLTEEEAVSYMKSLATVAVKLRGKDRSFGLGFSKSNVKELNRRMRLMRSNNQTKRFMQVLLSFIMCALLLFTGLVIIEPYSLEGAGDGGIAITSENAVLIKNGEVYEVYVSGKYIFTTEDLLGFDGIKIYESMEEYLNDEEN